MKPTNHFLSDNRRALAVTIISLLVGAATAAAQSTTTPSSSTPSSSSNSNSDSSQPSSTTSGSSMSNSGATGSSYNSSGYNSGTNSADTTNSGSMASSSRSGKLDWADRHFISKAADGNQDEIQVAQLASERASNPDVKTFAQKLVDDHTKLGSELTTLASTKNVKIDNEKSQSRTYKRLAKASGNDFDREFISNMIDEHEKDIKEFQKRANDAKDPDVKSFAENQLTTLREHLQMAQNLQSSIVPTGRESTSSGRATSSGSTSSETSSSMPPTSGTSAGTSSSSTTTTGGRK